MTEPIPTRHHDCEVLIVGGGAAATMAAFECADAGVAVIQASKGRATSGTTTVARGGFAAAMGKGGPRHEQRRGNDEKSCHVRPPAGSDGGR